MRSLRFIAALAALPVCGVLVSADVPGAITRLSIGGATSTQNSPAISGSQVVWTDVAAPGNFDIYLHEITAGFGFKLTSTPTEQEFLEDIDAGNIVWTHAGGAVAGDIVLFETATGQRTVIAASTDSIRFQEPAIRGRYVAFLRVSDAIDVDLYDRVLGMSFPVTNDAAVQARPRVGADHVVFEDYSSGNADILAYPIPGGPAFLVAGGPDAQLTPDIDLNNIVFIQHTGGTDQLVLFDLTTGTTRQLTSVASTKIRPRISGSRIVWADDRNGNLDLYLYDLATNVEDRLVVGPGDQWLSDIDGDRVVYTDNSSSYEEIHLFTIAPVAAYSFTGFFAPVRNLPVHNQVKAGRAIPIKFSLGGDQGFDIFAAGYPASTQIPCNSSALTDAVEGTVTAGASTLRYDAAAGLYEYVWKTSDAWANTCRQFVMRLRDGNYYRANFSFK